mmetsp:Transcript_11221/g.35632  ORF Transcript_11221/g.35632 Transcript_11221/m.35632 type:complete len:295 (+) Transcript_11221:159-1043(+)
MSRIVAAWSASSCITLSSLTTAGSAAAGFGGARIKLSESDPSSDEGAEDDAEAEAEEEDEDDSRLSCSAVRLAFLALEPEVDDDAFLLVAVFVALAAVAFFVFVFAFFFFGTLRPESTGRTSQSAVASATCSFGADRSTGASRRRVAATSSVLLMRRSDASACSRVRPAPPRPAKSRKLPLRARLTPGVPKSARCNLMRYTSSDGTLVRRSMTKAMSRSRVPVAVATDEEAEVTDDDAAVVAVVWRVGEESGEDVATLKRAVVVRLRLPSRAIDGDLSCADSDLVKLVDGGTVP